VRREGHDDQRSNDVCSVYELHHLNVLQLCVSHDELLSNSSVLRSHAVLCSQGNARLEASRYSLEAIRSYSGSRFSQGWG
jgi:hypothetical protein